MHRPPLPPVPKKISLVLISIRGWVDLRAIKSGRKNSNDAIGNRTRDLPSCSAVPQPAASPAACLRFSPTTAVCCTEIPSVFRADNWRNAKRIVTTCATLTLKEPHSVAGRLENDSEQKKLFLTYSTGFVYLPSNPEGSKKSYFAYKM